MKEKINSFFNTRAFFVIISILASFALWAYICYGENQDVEVKVNNVEIEYLNADLLTDNNLVVTSIDQSTLNLKFTGKRNTVIYLNNTNVSATVDYADIIQHSGSTGSYLLRYEISYDNDIDDEDVSVSYASFDYVTVTVEKMVSKTLTIEAVYDGGPAEGYSAKPVELSEKTVTISGPDSLVSSVSNVQAVFSAYDFTSEVKQNVELTLLDNEGNKIESDKLVLGITEVTVTIPVVMVKEVSLEVKLTGAKSALETNTTVDVYPSKITLSGDADTLRDLNVITLGTIDLNSFATNYEDTLAIKIPNGVTNMTGITTATVSVSVTDVDVTRLSVTNIDYKNQTSGIYYKIITQSLDVTLRGSSESIENVNAENVRIVADLSELGNATGTFQVTAKIYVDGYSDIDAIGSYTVTVSASTEPFAVEDGALADDPNKGA